MYTFLVGNSGKGLYLKKYPLFRPNTDTIQREKPPPAETRGVGGVTKSDIKASGKNLVQPWPYRISLSTSNAMDLEQFIRKPIIFHSTMSILHLEAD